MILKENSKIFYPSQGAGFVKCRKVIEFGGKKKEYFEFELVNNYIRISSPIEAVEHLGVRPVTPLKKLNEALKTLKEKPMLEPDDKNYNNQIDQIKYLHDRGLVEDLVKVVQYCNYIKTTREREGRTIPVQIRKFLKKSAEMLSSELAVSTGKEFEKAEESFVKITGISA